MKRRVYRVGAGLGLLAAIGVFAILLTDNALKTGLMALASQWPDWLRLVVGGLGGYVIGSIPFGYLIVGVASERDIREVGSGRTGGTNVLRSAGFGAALFSVIADLLKGAIGVLFGALILPGSYWPLAVAGLGAVLGHNAPIFLAFHGGAGTMTNMGVATVLWMPSLLFILPVFLLGWWRIRIASLTSLIIAGGIAVIFVVRAVLGAGPWEFAAYGIGSFALIAYALRPNIQRLIAGTEPMVPRVGRSF